MDSGATVHICCNKALMTNVKQLEYPQSIFLPNGATQQIFEVGTAQIASELVLSNVFFVPSFTRNLVSTFQLSGALKVRCTFFHAYCLIQRLDSDPILCMVKAVGHLYVNRPTLSKYLCHDITSC